MSLSNLNLREELARLTRFGANLAEAHSCAIFLPSNVLQLFERAHSADQSHLELAAIHTLCTNLDADTVIASGVGLIGWVAKHKRAIHVSPFEHDSRTLGMYSDDVSIKSFIGVPILLDGLSKSGSISACGALVCDSKKTYAFSKLHGKMLEELAAQITSTVMLAEALLARRGADNSWDGFLSQAHQLSEALGLTSLDVLRLRLSGYAALESEIGTQAAARLTEQVTRLVQQSLPPHFPIYKAPNGDIIVVVDNMMTAFFENKIRAVCERVRFGEYQVNFEFVRCSMPGKFSAAVSLERLIAQSATAPAGASRQMVAAVERPSIAQRFSLRRG